MTLEIFAALLIGFGIYTAGYCRGYGTCKKSMEVEIDTLNLKVKQLEKRPTHQMVIHRNRDWENEHR